MDEGSAVKKYRVFFGHEGSARNSARVGVFGRLRGVYMIYLIYPCWIPVGSSGL